MNLLESGETYAIAGFNGMSIINDTLETPMLFDYRGFSIKSIQRQAEQTVTTQLVGV